MISTPQSEQLTKLIQESQTFLVLLPPNPEEDWVVAALTLAGGLESLGKKVTLGCSSAITLSLPGVENIKPTVGGRNLIVSFPYKESMVGKVSYDIDEANERFNLIIKPKDDSEPLDPKTVEFTFTGATADLVLTLGLNTLEDLGKIYSDEKAFLDSARIANLRKSGSPIDFTDLDIQSPKLSSLTELVAHLLKDHQGTISREHASAVYKLLTQKTQNFTSFSVTPETFELAAYLLRQGAQRPQAFTPPFPKPSFQPPVQTQNQPAQPKFTGPKPSVPSDWQGPKIFRAGDNKPDLLK